MTRMLLIALVLGGVTSGCTHGEAAVLRKQSKSASRAVKRADEEQLAAHVLPGARSGVDLGAMTSDPERKAWAAALAEPEHVQPEALVFLEPDAPVAVVWTDQGWRFAEDPTDYYAQDTPRRALRALVRASRLERWDVLLDLAPRRYRLGLSTKDLEQAWTAGEQGEELRRARDRLAGHLADPIVADAHEAVLDMGGGHVARLEREGDRWVVVDF